MIAMHNYQNAAARTLHHEPKEFSPKEIALLFNALGLASEAGECADTLKKQIWHGHGFDSKRLIDELGDVLWYVAAICTLTNLDLATVMDANIAKLQKRYPNGFTPDDSVTRSDCSYA